MDDEALDTSHAASEIARFIGELYPAMDDEPLELSQAVEPGETNLWSEDDSHRSGTGTLEDPDGEVPDVLAGQTGAERESPVVRPPASGRPTARGHYELLGEIGHGGMGTVFKGRDPDLGRDLAVKVLHPRHRNAGDLVRRFIEEAQIGGQLQHPGIVPVYELGSFSDGRPYFTMKLIKGRTLATLLNERVDPAQDLPRLLGIFEQVAQTMAYAHSRGVIHRDLKPSNIMVGSFGEVQVMDWGLAKILPRDGAQAAVDERPAGETVVATVRPKGEGDHTEFGSALGTPAYMAPEQACGETDTVDRRADVFALGSILCEILTGSPAFADGSTNEVLRSARRGDTAAALARLERCGADLELLGLARDCLAVDARQRPADAGVVAGRMSAYLAGVQERLRAAELSRVETQARAEEEAKRRVLAERLAEEERGRAEEATRRAALERQRRRLQLGLAASLLAFTAAAGFGTAYFEQRQAHAAAVEQILTRVSVLRDQARDHANDLARWQVALAAIDKADRALSGDVAAQERIAAFRSAVEEGAAAERDRQLLDRLVDIRSAEADDPGGGSTDKDYAEAFRGAGLGIATLTTGEAARRIWARPLEVKTALTIAVDDWAGIRRDRRKDAAGALALSALANAVDPDDWRVGLRRALDLPEPPARLEALRRMAKDAPFRTLGPISLDLLGRALKDAGDPAGAEAVLWRAQRLHPDDVWINYDLARALENLARRDEAIRYDMAARSLRRETAHELAHLLEARGELDGAIAIFEDLRRVRPGNGRHLGCLGRALLKQGRSRGEAAAILAEAEEADREAIRLRPDNAMAHFSLGFALYMQGKLDQAIEEYRTAIRIQPETAEFHDTLCELFGRQGKLNEATEEYLTAIRIQPSFANVYNTYGDMLFWVRRDFQAAATEFRKAIARKPDNAIYHNNLGLALQRLGRPDEALVEYRTASNLNPSFADAYLGVGEILESRGKVDEAIVEYRTALRLDPNEDDAHNLLARALVKTPGRGAEAQREALEHARRAVTLSPNDGPFRNTLALAEYRAGNWADSIVAAERSIELTKGVDASNWFLLAMALWQQGDKERSRSFFDRAVSWTRKNDPKKADQLLLWREAAVILGQPSPDAPPVDLPADPFAP
jgi:serine/threonine-protein kinase